MSNFLNDLTSSDELRLAAVLGALALVVGAVGAGLVRRSAPAPIGGALFAAVAGYVLWLRFPIPGQVIVGCVLLGLGGLLGSSLGDRFIGALPGALVLTFGVESSPLPPVVSGIALAVVVALVTDHDASFRSAATTMPLLFATTVGVLVTVPDTEQAMVLVGAAAPLVLLGWPLRIASLGGAGAAAIGLIGYVAITAVRPGAVVGALGAFGLMLAQPIGALLRGSSMTALLHVAQSRRRGLFVVLALHAVLAFGASRIAGLQQSPMRATLLLTPFLLAGVAVAALPYASPPGTGEVALDDVTERGMP